MHGILLGAPPASAESCNISQAYNRRAEGTFPVFWLPYKWVSGGWHSAAESGLPALPLYKPTTPVLLRCSVVNVAPMLMPSTWSNTLAIP